MMTCSGSTGLVRFKAAQRRTRRSGADYRNAGFAPSMVAFVSFANETLGWRLFGHHATLERVIDRGGPKGRGLHCSRPFPDVGFSLTPGNGGDLCRSGIGNLCPWPAVFRSP